MNVLAAISSSLSDYGETPLFTHQTHVLYAIISHVDTDIYSPTAYFAIIVLFKKRYLFLG